MQRRLVKMIHVIVDDREVHSDVVRALRQIKDLEIEVKRLALGDYWIDGKLLVERKTFGDLAGSIKDGRFFKQAIRLASSTVRGAVILEGTADDLLRNRMRREAIQGALITLTILLGIPVLRSKDQFESARLMIHAARQIGMTPNRSYPRKGKRPKGKRQLQLHILQGLPGIGPGRAARLLETFGSVEAVIKAETFQLASVPGIGHQTALAIRKAVAP
jgi:DNA excision repair protein ERCC-4